MTERLPLLNKGCQSLPTISLRLAVDDPYDYRVTVELKNGQTMSAKFLSATRFEEGQVVTVQGKRCLVNEVSPPDPTIPPGERQIVTMRCFALRD